MLKIYLTRHGQDRDNSLGILNGHRDEPLTKIGLDQARTSAAKIKKTGIIFDKIYTSPLRRAHKTAGIIAEALNLPEPLVMPELIERNFGAVTGQPTAKIAEMCAPHTLQTGTVTYFLCPEGAETFPQLLLRAKKLLAKLAAKHKNGNILLVTHGDFGKMIYAQYYELNWQDVLRLFHFGNSDLLELSPDSHHENTHIHKITQYNL